jgi:tRNA dimethylallyltransferase
MAAAAPGARMHEFPQNGHASAAGSSAPTMSSRVLFPAPLVAVVGPTGSGKTELALQIAERFGGEIVNTDSLQVYRSLDIGTAKPDASERTRAPHHLLDVVNPDEAFSAGDYVRAARRVLEDLAARSKLAVLCGGTGLYFRALMQGIADIPEIPADVRLAVAARMQASGPPALHAELARRDPASAQRIEPNDRQRIARALEVLEATGRPLSVYQAEQPFSAQMPGVLSVGFAWERANLYRRLDARVEQMIARGLIDEVQGVLDHGYSPELKPLKAIGYLETIAYLQGRLARDALVPAIQLRTRHYAKRQVTWFKRHPEVVWCPPQDSRALLERIERFVGGG